MTISYFFGFYPKNGESMLYKCYSLFAISVIMIPYLILQIINIFLIDREIILIANSLMCLILPDINLITKILVFAWQKESIQQLIKDIDGPEFNPDLNSIKNGSKIQRVMKNIQVMSKAMLSGYTLTCIMLFIYMPSTYKTLPIKIWLPFDYTQGHM